MTSEDKTWDAKVIETTKHLQGVELEAGFDD